MTYYATTILVYAGVAVIACIALNLQFGLSGIVNFGFIIFQAAGAYTAAVLALPPQDANGGFQRYVLGLQLPFPVPWLGAALVGGVLAVPVGLVVLRRLRADYQAIAMLVISVIANTVITNARPFLNGAAGLTLVPAPLADQRGLVGLVRGRRAEHAVHVQAALVRERVGSDFTLFVPAQQQIAQARLPEIARILAPLDQRKAAATGSVGLVSHCVHVRH